MDTKTYLYYIKSDSSERFYIGITNNVANRKRSHIYRSRTTKSALYDWMNKHTDWYMVVVNEYSTRKDACEAEKVLISFFRHIDKPLLNYADGGDGGFCVKNTDEWRAKLKLARKGRTPAKGMTHTPENKKLFKDVSRKYWDTRDTYDPDEVLKYTHKEAKERFGISTTHYYRLRKRSISGEQDN